ncbi:MAG: adenylate/guanylate cyclase domain-containing protein, partial [Peptococcaceae bacterium]|jgi:adenylate cyclase|nr:adenylate/guanylate cyclase domain-containing protein [Peptococcaceae bacterium]
VSVPVLLTALFSALLLTAALSFGVIFKMDAAAANPLYGADMALSDALYQRAGRISGEVVVIGMDARSLEDFGPFPWPRDVMAAAIKALNADPGNRPAVIGVDVLFTGESDPAADAYLAEAAAEYGNVVVAAASVYGGRMVTGEYFHMESGVAISHEEPYERLREASAQGHVNVMLDQDGILRHGIGAVNWAGGEEMAPFASVIYEKYAAYHGLEVLPPAVSRQGVFYIPFTALPGAFEIASVSDLAAGAVLDTGGKIVLVGPYAAGLQDAAVTSIDHGAEMYGVEVHANIIESFLQGAAKKEIPRGGQVSSVFSISAVALMWLWDRRILSATFFWLLLAGGHVAASAALYGAGYVTHALWIPFAVTVLYIASVAVNYARAALEKRRVTNTFKRYVAPEIVNEILKQGVGALELGGKLCDIAVLFVDIRGFTPMSEALAAPDVVEILNRYLTLTSSCVTRNGGTLDKFVGDATMAFWGAPVPREDYVFEAVKSALDMIEGAKPLEREILEKYGRSVGFGIGVHCGPAVVGNIGNVARMDYTAIGDTVNTAARLEANAPAGKILVSRAVADALRGRVGFTSLGDSVKLKGKAAGFEVLTADGLAGAEP